MALVAAPELRKAVIEMVRFVDGVVPVLGLDKQNSWGEGAEDVVKALLDEAQTETVRTIHAKLAAAQARFATLKATLPASQVEAVLLALSVSPVALIAEEQPHECPVCHCMGLLSCDIERGPVEYDQDDDGIRASVTQTAYPVGFKCFVCHLELSGDTMQGFDFPDEIELEDDHDPDEMHQYDPGDDDWRGTDY